MTARRITALLLILSLCMFGGAHILRAEPPWIQHTERVVGAGSPTYPDVINRPDKYIWNAFKKQHLENGFHNFSAMGLKQLIAQAATPARRYGLSGNGTGSLAEAVVYRNAGSPNYGSDNLFTGSRCLWLTVSTVPVTAASSLLRRVEDGYNRTFFDFGIAADGRLRVTGYNDNWEPSTIYSMNNAFSEPWPHRPRQVGFCIFPLDSEIFFFFDGQTELIQYFALAQPSELSPIEHLQLGVGLSGIISQLAFSDFLILSPGTKYTPFGNTPEQCPGCEWLGNFTGTGTSLNSQNPELYPHINFALTQGTWLALP